MGRLDQGSPSNSCQPQNPSASLGGKSFSSCDETAPCTDCTDCEWEVLCCSLERKKGTRMWSALVCQPFGSTNSDESLSEAEQGVWGISAKRVARLVVWCQPSLCQKSSLSPVNRLAKISVPLQHINSSLPLFGYINRLSFSCAPIRHIFFAFFFFLNNRQIFSSVLSYK